MIFTRNYETVCVNDEAQKRAHPNIKYWKTRQSAIYSALKLANNKL